MHISVICDLDACIYDAGFFVTNQRTNEQGDSRSRMLGLSGTSAYTIFVYLCICVFVFVYFCMRHLVISVKISLGQELSENVLFVWSKTS